MEATTGAIRLLANYKSALPALWQAVVANNAAAKSKRLMSSSPTTTVPDPPTPPRRPGGRKRTLHSPIFNRANEYRTRIALWDSDGSFLYEDIYRRSLELSQIIHGMLQSHPTSINRQCRVAFICQGASYVISQWSVWMGGHVAVPLSAQMSRDALEHAIRHADVDLVVANNASVDRVKAICDRSGKRLICLDQTWTANPKKDFDVSEPMPNGLLREDAYYAESPAAMILYDKEKRPIKYTHTQLNAQTDSVGMAWDLSEKCAMLNALPLTNPYAIVTAMMSAMNVGGKVVMLPEFDSLRVWSHLLGIGIRTSQPLPKVNFLPSLPSHVNRLLDRYRITFQDRRSQDFVRNRCLKRLRAGLVDGAVPRHARNEWRRITTNTLVHTHSCAAAGTVLSGKIVPPMTKYEKEEDLEARSTRMLALPGVQTRIVQRDEILDQNARSDSLCRGELLLRGPGMAADAEGVHHGWLHTGDAAVLSNGCFKIEEE